MRIKVLITFLVLSISVFGDSVVPNLKEGAISAYDLKVNKRIYKKLSEQISLDRSIELNEAYMADNAQVCPVSYLEDINSKTKRYYKKRDEKRVKAYLKILRQRGLLDDFTYLRLNSYSKIFSKFLKPRTVDRDFSISRAELETLKSTVPGMLAAKRNCQSDNYRNLVIFIKNTLKIKYSSRVRNVLDKLYEQKLISKNDYRVLYVISKNKIDNEPISFSEYKEKLQKVIELSKTTTAEQTDFFLQFKDKKSKSTRIKIYEKYNHYQMYKLSKLVEKMMERLNAPAISVVIETQEGMEVDHEFSVAQQFRYSMWKLNDEINRLKLDSTFKGVGVAPMEVLAVAYELGTVTSEELEGLKEIIKIIVPMKKKKNSLRSIINTTLTAAPIVFPEVSTFIVLTSILFRKYFPAQTQDSGEIHVF